MPATSKTIFRLQLYVQTRCTILDVPSEYSVLSALLVIVPIEESLTYFLRSAVLWPCSCSYVNRRCTAV